MQQGGYGVFMFGLRGRNTALKETERELEKLTQDLYSGRVTGRDILIIHSRIDILSNQRDNYIQEMRNMYMNGINLYGTGAVPDYLGYRTI